VLSDAAVDPGSLAYEPVYSQREEQTLIVDRLAAAMAGSTGRVLDVGAYDGVSLSNSRRLIEMGWEGVLVEPQPGTFARLARLYEGVERVTLVNAALAARGGLRRFFISRRADGEEDFYGAMDEGETRRWSGAEVSFQEALVSCVEWEELFRSVGRRFAFVTIDVEGGNTELFAALRLDAVEGLRLVCVEKDMPVGGDHAGLRARQVAHARAHGFGLIHETAENLLFERCGA
jgi:FkbM family methyltransferase